MLFYQRNKRIRLSKRLGWGIRKGIKTSTKFWIFGSIIFSVATLSILNIIFREEPDPKVLGETETTVQNQTEPRMQFIDYTVEAEDTLFNISQEYGTPWTAIAQLNDLQPPFNIRPGQIIKIPLVE